MSLPLPAADFEDRPFWTSGAGGRLTVQRCASCRTLIHPPRPACRHCRSTDLDDAPLSGQATVFSYTVNHQPWSRALASPYVIAIVEPVDAPGIHLTTRLSRVDPDQVRIGMPVRVEFEQHDDVWLPLFVPAVP